MNPTKLTGLIAIGLLAGCSSLPPKKELLPGQYQEVATALVHGRQCAVEGLMDPGLAATGTRQVEWLLQERIAYNPLHLDYWKNTVTRQGVTQQGCNVIAFEFQKAKQGLEASSRIQQAQAEEARRIQDQTKIKKPVWCNKIGTTVVCD